MSSAKVTDLREKQAQKRQKAEMRALHEVNASVNHSPGDRVKTGLTVAKSMHHGVDLCGAITKARKLKFSHGIGDNRVEYAIAEKRAANDDGGLGEKEIVGRVACLLVRMPDTMYVLADEDDFVHKLEQFEHKIAEVTVNGKLGVWEEA